MPRRPPIALFVFVLYGINAAAQGSYVLLTESFDSSSTLPGGWESSRVRFPTEDDAAVISSLPRSPPHCVFFSNATVAQSLVSGPLDFSGHIPGRLSFFVRRSSSFSASLLVEASLDGGATFPFRLGDTIRTPVANAYVRVEIPLPDHLRGMHARLRWRVAPEMSGATGTLRLDDISVTATPMIDLGIAALSFSPPAPHAGDTLTVLAILVNVGYERPLSSSAEFFLDRNVDGVSQPEEPSAVVRTVNPPGPGDSISVAVRLGPLQAGRGLLRSRLLTTGDRAGQNDTASLVCYVGPLPGSLVLNELMYAPGAGEPEWIELYNNGGDTLDLSGWSIADATSRRTLERSAGKANPGAFAVLTRDTNALRELRPATAGLVIQVPGFPSLNNSGDAVVLRDPSGSSMDSVFYFPGWGGSIGGISLERRDPAFPALDSLNWESSRDGTGATPGLQNSVRAVPEDASLEDPSGKIEAGGAVARVHVLIRNRGTRPLTLATIAMYDDRNGDGVASIAERVAALVLAEPLPPRGVSPIELLWEHPSPGAHRLLLRVELPGDLFIVDRTESLSLWVPLPAGMLEINEIMASPPAGGSEYIELLQTGPGSCRLIGIAFNGTSLHLPDTAVFASGGFLVVAADSTVFARFPWLAGDRGSHTIVQKEGFGLRNEGDTVVVRDPAGLIVDRVEYHATWHHPAHSDASGRSLERIVSGGGTNDSRNWSTCVDARGGTPGRRNSIAVDAPPAANRLSCAPNPFSPDGDGQDDATVITFEIPSALPAVTVTIYDIRGRVVRRLAASRASGSVGSVVWDGRDESRRPARVGIYIVMLEAGVAGGETVQGDKCSVVVARRF